MSIMLKRFSKSKAKSRLIIAPELTGNVIDESKGPLILSSSSVLKRKFVGVPPEHMPPLMSPPDQMLP